MEWINIDDKLPEIDEFVLFCSSDNGYMGVDHIDKDMNPFDWINMHMITHWMPLPEPPDD
jgi:hypothetical protein